MASIPWSSRAAKRALDASVALVGLALAAPLLLAIALWIRRDSPGPVFYRGVRVGLGGRTFRIFKFRSMVLDADRIGGPTTSEDDPRVTRPGRVLRRFKLDELPQLANVLLGEMSLVGPRPDVASEVAKLTERERALVLSVRPGMTDWASIRYHNEGEIVQGHPDPHQAYEHLIRPGKLSLQQAYARDASLRTDLAILFATFRMLYRSRLAADAPGAARTGKGPGAPPLPSLVLGRFRVTARRRFAFFLLGDLALVVGSVLGAFVLRLESLPPATMGPAVAFFAAVAVAGTIGSLLLYGVYRVSWRFVGFRDVLFVAASVLVSTLAMGGLVAIWGGRTPLTSVPAGVVLIQAPLAFLALSGFRLYRRALQLARPKGSRQRSEGDPTLLLGAGEAGEQVLRSILKTGARRAYDVLGILDDDPLTHGTSIHGVPVLGTTAAVGDHARALGAKTVIICVPEADQRLIRTTMARCRAAGVRTVRIIPPLQELVEGSITVQATREVSLEDLLGRDTVSIAGDEVRSLLRGRRVLVTGGAGTIGTELCKQVAGFGPSALTVLDIDETRLHDVVGDLREAYPGLRVEAALVDVRRSEEMERLAGRLRPEVVFHAAAMKHVAMMEQWPLAALEVNVLGTWNVMRAAEAAGCGRFVLISTDKAVEPAGVMGASKRLAEMVVFSGAQGPMVRAAVRFGNVIGSRGSVIPIFERQLKRGGPLTVTHPDVERFFMMTSEAVSLVLQAAALGDRGRLFILDMGKPVRILEVAKEFCRLHGLEPGADVPIVFTGLGQGEKLTEQLTYGHESLVSTSHPRVFAVAPGMRVPDDALALVRELVDARDPEGARRFLAKMFPGLAPAGLGQPGK